MDLLTTANIVISDGWPRIHLRMGRKHLLQATCGNIRGKGRVEPDSAGSRSCLYLTRKTISNDLTRGGSDPVMRFFEYRSSRPRDASNPGYGKRSDMATLAQMPLIRAVRMEYSRGAAGLLEPTSWPLRTFRVDPLRFPMLAGGTKAVTALKARDRVVR